MECQKCYKQFETVILLKYHYSSHFMSLLKKNYEHLMNSKNTCQECKKNFQNSRRLLLHIGVNHDKVNDILKSRGFEALPPHNYTDPLVQKFSNLIQKLESNPQMQEVMVMEVEIARNPRIMDRKMQNLEAMPGGMNILQRWYRDVEEPVLNALRGPNPFQDLRNNSATPSEVPATETNQPFPNPWALQQNTGTPADPTAPLGGQLGQGSGLFTSPGMQSLMGQMRDNPTLMSQMMSAPYMQSMFSTLANNPEQASAMLANNPLFAGNPALQQQVSSMMPQMLQQMQNPAVQQLMGNPEALQVRFIIIIIEPSHH